MDAGASAQVLCIVTKGDLPLNIAWSFHGSNITSDLGISTMPTGPMGSLLMIPSVGHKHRGSYTCKAANSAGVRTQTVELKVNGKKRGTQEGTGFFAFFLMASSLSWVQLCLFDYKPILFRSTRPSPSVLWEKHYERRSLCPSVLHCDTGRSATDHILVVPRVKHHFGPGHNHNSYWAAREYAHDLVCGAQAQGNVHLQSFKCSWS